MVAAPVMVVVVAIGGIIEGGERMGLLWALVSPVDMSQSFASLLLYLGPLRSHPAVALSILQLAVSLRRCFPLCVVTSPFSPLHFPFLGC